MPLDPKQIGLRVRTERRRLAMSQATLASLINSTQGHVSDWERGNHMMSLETAAAVAETLAVSLDHLVLGK
jgi:transcriptional regulator with XRE-family HTH domain